MREMDDDTAILLMVDSNLQREELLPSEKAFAYKMKLDAIKRQGKRTDLTSAQIVPKLQARDIVAHDAGVNRMEVTRYVRLTYLVPDLLDRVDNKTMAFNAAVEVSYLTEPEQLMLCDAIEREECTPNLSQAKRLKQYSQDGKLDENVMDAIMTEEKPIEDKLVLKGDVLAKYFPKLIRRHKAESHCETAGGLAQAAASAAGALGFAWVFPLQSLFLTKPKERRKLLCRERIFFFRLSKSKEV